MNKIKKSKKQKTELKLSKKQKIAYTFILIIIPVIILTLIELSLRMFHYGEKYSVFVDFEFYGKEYKRCNPEYGKKYFYQFHYTSPANDIFLKEKPKNDYRIFVMGSSTVFGFPYSPGVMFSRILHERLQDSYPDKNIEVVNTAITAVNSYTLQDIIDDILKEEPDAILIYAGHNEFYGALGIGSKEGFGQSRIIKILHLKMLNFRTYQYIRQLMSKLHSSIKNNKVTSESTTLMERIVSNKNIVYKSKVFNRAHQQYSKNMKSILRKARRKKVPVIYSEMISNIRDLKPFSSLQTKDFPSADSVFKNARQLDKLKKFTEAKDAYYKAKDFDCVRFRASEQINDEIRENAKKYGAILVPMVRNFEKNSPDGIIGYNLITEHLHPNVDGYFLMADGFYNALVENNLLGRIDSANYKPSSYYRKNWGFTELDSIYADLKVRQLTGGWPFKSDTIINNFIYDYKPKSYIDSLAYQAARYDDISLEIIHSKMAKYYLLNKQPEKAFKEYLSITKIEPYDIKYFIEAGNVLYDMKKYPEALKMFLSSLKIKSNIYTVGKVGELYALTGNYNKAIPYLEDVRQSNTEISKLNCLTLLYQSYEKTNNPEKCSAIFKEISKLKSTGGDKKQIILYTTAKVKEQINQALVYLRSNQLDRALVILYEANKIEETNLANRFIGEILFNKNDQNALPYLKKAYMEYGSDPNFLNTLCYASLHFKDFQFAKTILPELKKLSPDNPNIKEYESLIAKNGQ